MQGKRQPETENKRVAARDEKSRQVREMFGAIAGRYDLLNHLLSGNVDRLWRQACLREVRRRCDAPQPRILDLGCGTADLALVFSDFGRVIGCDFCHPMLQIGRRKIDRSRRTYPIELLEADALRLPFEDDSFDVVVSAFVVRNLASIDQGFVEMRRVLRPGGVVGVLDFGLPRAPVLGRVYRFYFTRVLPRLGKYVSGVDGPYQYLSDSVRAFPSAEALALRMTQAGFDSAEHRLLTGGIAILLLAKAGQ